MNISHKKNFFDNIGSLDHQRLVTKIQSLLESNKRENTYFDLHSFRRRLLEYIPEDRIERVMASACRQHTIATGKMEAAGPTGADLSRLERRNIRKKMRSRR